ncbi:MAG: hypothetical protein EA385_16590 [Salinarimonadaceae bacterium]|nr:MAG: hypothetical protein EA385_16590 [Salinarimonadaceae bacterium]
MNMHAALSLPVRLSRDDRAGRARVREERLRATAGLDVALSLSSWRGRSGRRYVVGIMAAAETEADDLAGGVMIAVRRDQAGFARVVDVSCAGRDRSEWLAAMIARGAEEIHLHRLAADEAARRAVAEDLMDGL